MSIINVHEYFECLSNYKICNKSNLYNSFIAVLNLFVDQEYSVERNKIIEIIKMDIGLSFYEDLKMYLFRKNPRCRLVELL